MYRSTKEKHSQTGRDLCLHNALLVTSMLSAIVAQILKIPFTYLTQHSWNWRAAFKPGGMPSSHTALMVGLTSSTLFQYGWNNPFFAIAAAVTLIVIYDATGVRRQAGHQAMVLNELTATMETLNQKLCTNVSIKQSSLKEVLGHSPLEVLGGIVVGTVVALVIVRYS